MGSSGAHWCRRRVRFNRVSREGLGSFGAEPGQVHRVPETSGEGLGGCSEEGLHGRLCCRARSSSTGFPRRFRRRCGRPTGFRRRFEKVPEKVCMGRLWHRARSASTDPEKVWEAVVQSQVRFKRVPGKVPEKGPGSLGAKPSQVQPVPEKVAEAKPGQVHLTHGNLAEVFPALGFAARIRKICKNEMLRLLGIPPKLIVFCFFFPWSHVGTFRRYESRRQFKVWRSGK